MSATSKWTVGQRIVERVSHHRLGVTWYEGTITKIGRKWMRYRRDGWDRDLPFDAATGAGGSGTVYPDRAIAEAALLRVATWRALLRAVHRLSSRPPRTLTTQQIHDIAAMLDLTLQVQERDA